MKKTHIHTRKKNPSDISCAHRVARVVCEVNLGQAHMDNQELYAHDATLIAVLVLGNNGHFGFSHTLQTREQKLLLSRRDRKSLQVHTHERGTGFTGLLTIHVGWYQSG